MRFGPLPLDEALGAVLAHSVLLPGGRLPKGRVLGTAEIAALRDAGHSTVTAAKLEPGELDEDEAAGRIAAALLGPGLTASAPATGRVNLFAAQAGVLLVDAARIDALNLLDESVTVATLPAHAAMAAGQMAATVKIIPFGAPASVVAEVERLAAGDPPLRLAPYLGLRAALVQTVLPGLKPSVLDKTVEVTRDRLASVGGTLETERRVAHDEAAVAEELGALAAEGFDLLLLAGASAVTDRRDVLPTGIEAAGGTVVHFGMPVDPGNLLLLGRLGERPVLGLPGCARSPKLNGFDWVLQRMAAGLEVSRADIMRLGVGGLLTEIASRPLPRAAAAPPAGPRVAALVLAAGLSRRMGSNKLLADDGGAPLVRRTVEAALASRARPVLVVTGNEAERVRAALEGLEVAFIHAPDHAEGLSASLKAGLRALPDMAEAVLVCLGDMPRVPAETLDRLIAAWNPVEGRAICVPVHQGRRGNPVLWDRRFMPDMLALTGDQGAKALLSAHAELVAEVLVDAPGVHLDVDTPEALAALNA
ncbi:MAG TPA: molybdopterin-binding/glycosyltransferase family 2 protein [Azospirillaceae bacterium]|nr:molybdopterin-binding/glycosyltransferase family 2 protein [Azospirillaceae bacterium]